MASRYISWMDVVVGDPKTTITFVEGLLPVQLVLASPVTTTVILVHPLHMEHASAR